MTRQANRIPTIPAFALGVLWFSLFAPCSAAPGQNDSPSVAHATGGEAPRQEKLSRIWANEPPLVRLARDRFQNGFTEVDARFFAAVAAGEWADFRPTPETTFNVESPASWQDAPTIAADRLTWLATDPAASKLVPSRGIWLRGARIDGRLDFYRAEVPFSLALYDCLLNRGMNLAHGKTQEIDFRRCCSSAIYARGASIAENAYFIDTAILGGADFIDACFGGDLDFSGALVFHGTSGEQRERAGISLNLHDATVGGDLRLASGFRSIGEVRLIGVQVGRSLTATGGQFQGNGEIALDARRSVIGNNVELQNGFQAHGGVELRRAKIGGDLNCDGGEFLAAEGDALFADLVEVGGQVHLGGGFRAVGEVRLINSTVGGDVDCDHGQFHHPQGDALSLDGAEIGRSLRMGGEPKHAESEGPSRPGFAAHGCVRLWGTQIGQDLLGSHASLSTPDGIALLGNNLRVGSRVVLAGAWIEGTTSFFGAEITHDVDLRGAEIDGSRAPDRVAIQCGAIRIGGHLYTNAVLHEGTIVPFRSRGLVSLPFASIAMHWDLSGAQFLAEGGAALDASDSRVGGYVNIDSAELVGEVSFSRAKIEGVWVLVRTVNPRRMSLDLRFADIWVIKDESLDDWPPEGQLLLEGLVYDYFDDDSPLDVNERLEWLARQYSSVDRGKNSFAKRALRRAYLAVTSSRVHEKLVTAGDHGDRATAPGKLIRASYERQSEVTAKVAIVPASPVVEPESADEVVDIAQPIVATSPLDREKSTHGESPSGAKHGGAPSTPSELTPSGTDPEVISANRLFGDREDLGARRCVTQPYTQLASVYRAIGQDENANIVLVARAERLGASSPPLSANGLWYRYLGRLIGYGYEPFRAVKLGALIVVLGTFVFAIAGHRNLMAEIKVAEEVISQENECLLAPPTYPRFNPFVYSLDVFLPFVDLHQLSYWIPGEKRGATRPSRNCMLHVGPWSLKWSAMLRTYLWFQTLAGWTLCTLLAAAVTGIVKS